MSKSGYAKPIDATCGHEMCDHKGTYTTKARCINCGWQGAVKWTKGHQTHGGTTGPECPRCECNNLTIGEFVGENQ